METWIWIFGNMDILPQAAVSHVVGRKAVTLHCSPRRLFVLCYGVQLHSSLPCPQISLDFASGSSPRLECLRNPRTLPEGPRGVWARPDLCNHRVLTFTSLCKKAWGSLCARSDVRLLKLNHRASRSRLGSWDSSAIWWLENYCVCLIIFP